MFTSCHNYFTECVRSGIGRVVYEDVKSAKQCVEKLNNTSVMGKILEVFLDAFGQKCKEKYEELTTEKKPPPPPVVEEPPKKDTVDGSKEEDDRLIFIC